MECGATRAFWGGGTHNRCQFFLGRAAKKWAIFGFYAKKNSNFVCYERGACWQLPSLMRFLFDLKYDANEIQNFPFVVRCVPGVYLVRVGQQTTKVVVP